MAKNFKDLSEREILALAISLEEEDVTSWIERRAHNRSGSVGTFDLSAIATCLKDRRWP